MVLLSVIIVNYNVRYFLEQCLCSVRKAMEELAVSSWQLAGNTAIVEIFVVDNNSTDGSVEYLQVRFPFVQFIVNKENTGFGKANNQALARATGQYILFLNPDTIVPEDAFTSCITFLQAHPDAGALGVHMIDGGGQFLKESKRGFPSPWVSFGKMSGLIKLFPGSRWFAGYYMGYLPNTASYAVDALSGAYMLAKKAVLDATGGFDEQFFMYAEDIDLSYRIQQAGYTNYYFADCTIIHFKGESTRKDATYVQLFYKAMIQFVRKHFHGGSSRLYVKGLEAAIWLKAAMAKKSTKPEAGNTKSEIRSTKDEIQYNTFILIGDSDSKEQVSSQLNNRVTDNAQTATATVLCEGVSFSFKELIAQLPSEAGIRKVFVHASGSGSIVMSSSKDRQGKVIELPVSAL